MSTTTSGATIFYTDDGTTPVHTGATPTGSTLVYSGPVNVGKCNETIFKAVAWKSGMSDSNVTSYDANYTTAPNCGGGGQAPSHAAVSPPALPSASTGTIIFSVWDGDWAILEEYTTGNVISQKYLQGLHGLVKTLTDNIYYYQDELGSTSHIANGTGALIESYQYDLYGKPRVYNSGGTYQPNATPVAKDLGNGGARWIPELSLYDDRNRFMSPDLGRFLQPDPIGFKGDSSTLYRYCGNDCANRTDPMGLAPAADTSAQGPRLLYATALSYGVTQIYLRGDHPFAAHHLEPGHLSGYPESPPNRDPKPNFVSPVPGGKDGLVGLEHGQVKAMAMARDIINANKGSLEPIIGVVYDKVNKQWGLTPTLTRAQQGMSKSQHGLLPSLPVGGKKQFGYGGQWHFHDNGRGISDDDRALANKNGIPVGVTHGGKSEMYVPRFGANPNGTFQGVNVPFDN